MSTEITDSQKGDLNVSLARCTDDTLFFHHRLKWVLMERDFNTIYTCED